MKRRGVDDDQQISAGIFGRLRRRVKPGVLTNQQAYLHTHVIAFYLKHTRRVARREVTPLVKHLVVGQLALGIGCQHFAFAKHFGGVVALLHSHAFGAQAVTCHHGRANHHRQAL